MRLEFRNEGAQMEVTYDQNRKEGRKEERSIHPLALYSPNRALASSSEVS
jgi:hypothetical protein